MILDFSKFFGNLGPLLTLHHRPWSMPRFLLWTNASLESERLWFFFYLGYVGKGFYGSTNEKAIMEEVYKNGPIPVAFNAAPDLYYYSEGVFITNP